MKQEINLKNYMYIRNGVPHERCVVLGRSRVTSKENHVKHVLCSQGISIDTGTFLTRTTLLSSDDQNEPVTFSIREVRV